MNIAMARRYSFNYTVPMHGYNIIDAFTVI